MIRILYIFWTILLFSTVNVAQINLVNPSFEDEPKDATLPKGWHPCKRGSTPDILPGFWKVYKEPSDGKSYIGLITREDGSWESIEQRLNKAIKANECYKFSIDLARSKSYEQYNLPIRLRIWGAKTKCKKGQLLGEINHIDYTDWKTHDIQFYATDRINYIILEAYYTKGMLVPYKGNVLIDNISTFERCIQAFIDVPAILQNPKG